MNMSNKIAGHVIFLFLDVLGLLLYYCTIMFILLYDVRLSHLNKNYLVYLLTYLLTFIPKFGLILQVP